MLIAGVSALYTGSAGAAPASTQKAHSAVGQSADSALAQARKTHHEVQVDAATTPTSTLTAHPNGTFTVAQSLIPVRKRVNGRWEKLDATLRKNRDGTVSTTTSSSALTLSGGGNVPLVSMSNGGRALALSLPMTLPTPKLAGNVATYSDVLPGVDLTVTADEQGGFTDVLVVKSAKAAANPALAKLALATQSTGVQITSDSAGNITAEDRGGRPAFTAGAPRMWDSAATPAQGPAHPRKVTLNPRTGRQVDQANGMPIASSSEGPGEDAHSAPVKAHLTGRTIQLTPASPLLADAKTAFPVYLAAPSFSAPSASGPEQAWTQTLSGTYANSTYWKSDSLFRVGDQDWDSPTFVARSYAQIGVPSALYGATVLDSEIDFTEEWSASCTPSPVQLWRTSAISSSTTYNHNKPSLLSQIGSKNVAYGWSTTACPAHGVGWDITSLMQTAANSKWGNITFGLVAGNETDKNGWKEFSNKVTVSTTYDHVPDTPTGLTTSPSTSCQDDSMVGDGDVTLNAGVSDPDGGTVGTHFQLWPHGNSANIIHPSDPNNLTSKSGTTARWTIPKADLESAANGKVTEFDWNVQVTDFSDQSNPLSKWSTTCHFSFDPTLPGPPVIAPINDGASTIGEEFTVSITHASGTAPASYEYQLNGHGPENVLADASGNATITIKPTRYTNILSVNSLSASSNVNLGDTATTVFNSNSPGTVPADSDLTGDGVADLLTVGNQSGLPSGLWLANGQANVGGVKGNSHVVASPTDIGVNGTGLNYAGSPSDFDGTVAVSGRFTDSGFQDVLAYSPTGTNAGGGFIISANGDGSPLMVQDSSNVHNLYAGSLQDVREDGTSDNPTQIANAGDLSGNHTGYPDLIGISGDPNNGYTLNLYPSQPGIGGYQPPVELNVNTPDGTADWNNWTIATTQLGSTGQGTTAMFLWKKTTGELDLWKGLDATTGTLTYTAYPVAKGWNTNTGVTLQAADINGDATPDLWTTASGGAATANVFTNLSATAAATLTKTTDTLSTANDTWFLNDAQTGTLTSAKDTTGTLNATGTAGATWSTGDLFSPAAQLQGSGYLSTLSGTGAGKPALATNADFTVSAWVKPQTLGGAVVAQDGSHTSGFALYSDAASKTWRFSMPTSDVAAPTQDVATASGFTAQIGAWTHLTATYQASTGRMELYIDGMDAATATHTTKWNAAGAFTIGAQQSNSARAGYFSGNLADVRVYKRVLTAPQVATQSGVPYIPAGTVTAEVSADFNGDHRSDIAHLYNCGGTHDALVVAYGDANGDGGFGPSHLIWDNPSFGAGIRSMAAGDFDHNGRSDIALFYNYADNTNHDAVFTLSAAADGSFSAPVNAWDSTVFGPNTQYMTAGDFNGDGNSDLALYYTYSGGSHDAIYTLTASGTGSFKTTPVLVWDDPNFGPGVGGVTAGDFNGDGKSDVGLYYTYSDGLHDALFTLTAHSNNDGGLSAPVKRWDDAGFGPGGQQVTSSDFNGDGKSDLALFYNYADNSHHHDAIFVFTSHSNGDGGMALPKSIWDNPAFGPNTQFMTSGDYDGDGRGDLSLYYDYVSQPPAEFTLSADSGAATGFDPPIRRYTDQ